MEKIFFAIGNEKVEKRITNLLDAEGFGYEVVYAAVHKEAVLSEIASKKPSILILTEGLPGKIDVFNLAVNIRRSFPEIRIIFLASHKSDGDASIANLVAFGIYDILAGEALKVPDIIKLIIHKNSFENVAHLLPKKGGLFDNESFDGISNNLGEIKGDVSAKSETIININSPNVVVQNENNEKADDSGEFKIEEIDISGTEFDNQQPNQNQNPQQAPKNPMGNLFGKIPVTIPITNPFKKNNNNQQQQQQQPMQDQIINQQQLPNMQGGFPIQQQQGYSQQMPGYPNMPQMPIQEQNPWQVHLPQQTPGMSGMPVGNNNMDGFHTIQSPRTAGAYNTVDLGGNRIVSAKQRLITFFSPKGGIGTTVTALNCAMEAAKRAQQRILLIEFNVEYSSLAYWFDLPNSGYGLEDALVGIGSDYNSINNAIITKDKMMKSSSTYIEGIKRMPEGLNFLIFSDMFYKKNMKPTIATQNLEKLITYCLYTLNYDEVYLDIATGTNRDIIDSSLISSGKNVILMSQDLAIISNVVMFFYDLSRKGLKFDVGLNDDERRMAQISYKNIYVINKYNHGITFTDKKIKEWTGGRHFCCIPENGSEINEMLSGGYIPLGVSKNKAFKEGYKYLVNLIEQ